METIVYWEKGLRDNIAAQGAGHKMQGKGLAA